MVRRERPGQGSPTLAEIQRTQSIGIVAGEVGMRLSEMFQIPQKLGLIPSMDIVVGSEIAVGLLKKDRRLMEAREKWWNELRRNGNEEEDRAVTTTEKMTLGIKELIKGLAGVKEAKRVEAEFNMVRRAANLVSAVYTQRVKDSLYSDPGEMGEKVKTAMKIALDSFFRSEENTLKSYLADKIEHGN